MFSRVFNKKKSTEKIYKTTIFSHDGLIVSLTVVSDSERHLVSITATDIDERYFIDLLISVEQFLNSN